MVKKSTQCLICGKEKTNIQLAKHRNSQLNSCYGFCKDCLNQHSFEEESVIVDLLRLMNIPFVSDVWENAIDTGGDNVFSKYIQLIATKRGHKIFLDSEMYSETATEILPDSMDFTLTSEIVERWGARDSEKEYLDLELSYKSLCKIKEPTTTLEQKRYVQNVKLGKALDMALESGDAKSIPQIRTAYTKDLEELGLNIDMSGQEEGRSLGMRIKEWEMHSPVPSRDEFNDVDNVKQYISKWFTVQMKRVFGLASEEEISQMYE